MIGFLRGTPLQSTPEELLLDVGGVGYRVLISLTTFGDLDLVGETRTIELFIHTHVREGAIELFGFSTPREQDLFELLIAVSGVGPRLARTVLSGMSAADLIGALATGDAARLATVPGIGKKTAQRLIVELKDKAAALATDLPTQPLATRDEDLVVALINLGYKRSQAEQAVAQARHETPEAEFQDLLRSSLARLSRA